MKTHIKILSATSPDYHLLNSDFRQRYRNVILPILLFDDTKIVTIGGHEVRKESEGTDFVYAEASEYIPTCPHLSLRHSAIVEHTSYGSYLVGPHGVDRKHLITFRSSTYYECYHYEFRFMAYKGRGLYISTKRILGGLISGGGLRPYASSDWSAEVRALFQPLVDEAQKNLI